MERKKYLDVAKLFAVLCVIYVHASVSYNPIRRTISAFFMPVFFIIYGMASSSKSLQSWKDVWQFVEKRMKSLIVPYVMWALIYAEDIDFTFVKGVLLGTNPSLGTAKTNSVLWFLPCMFVAVMLFQIYTNLYVAMIGKARKIGLSVFVMMLCGVISCKCNIIFAFGCDIAFSGCVFMIIGKGGGKRLFELFCENKSNCAKIIVATVGFLLTYVIVTCNLPYLERSGWQGVAMAVAVYGRYDLFLAAAVTGSYGLLLIAKVFENIKLFADMGRFSLVIMAVHYILFPYVKPLCNGIQDIQWGDILYPASVALVCFIICIPLCYIIDWAVPELNGKSVRALK